MRDVTVIGAGIAGCSVGYLLSERGFDVTVVEKDAVGGLLKEIELGEYHTDSAPHILFFDENEEAFTGDLFERFTDLESHAFYAKTYPTNDLSAPHDYPVSEANIDRWDDSETIHEELAAAPGKADVDYFDVFVRRQVGPTLYDRYYHNYTEKHWGISPNRITGDWFDFKINFPSGEDSFFSGAAYYPEEKYTTILNEMLSGCDVRFDAATGLDTAAGRIIGIETESGDTIGGDLFVNTIDPSILVDTADSLTYRSMVIHAAHVRASDCLFPEHVSWGYFPNHHDFTRITDYDFTPQDLPADEYLLTTEFPCFLGDDVWSQSKSWFDETLGRFLADQGIEVDFLASEIRRAPRAYPLPVEEEVETFNRINAELSAFENVENLGRVSTYEYIWIKDIVHQAKETVESISITTPQ